MYLTPHCEIASAVLAGSFGSRGLGVREVLTEQKRHALVHSSPISMIVAVEMPSGPPLQHSPMFGHLASSQTVWRERDRRVDFSARTLSKEGTGVWRKEGRRPAGPTLSRLEWRSSSLVLFLHVAVLSNLPRRLFLLMAM
jgi:hypothetical protein